MRALLHQITGLGDGRAGRRLLVLFGSLLMVATLRGQEPAHPLRPPDRSSPRATLKTFLEAGDTAGRFMAEEYLPSPSRAEFHRLASLGDPLVECLDLSEVAPAARGKVGRAAAGALYVTLSKIQLPPFDEVPGEGQVSQTAGTNATRWVIPNTEIAIERAPGGPRGGEFLFSANTVARAGEFCERVRGLAYTRPVPLEHLNELGGIGGGWMIPHRWVQALPSWLLAVLAGQAVWKWIALALMLCLFVLLLRAAYSLSRRGTSEHPFRQALARLVLPGFFLLATPAAAYLALVQLNLIRGVGSAIELAATAVVFVAGAWMSWRAAPVVAEAIIASPRIAPESIDAHLIRICARLLALAAAAALLAVGADRVGLPLYGIVAGLGIGGLALALAAQPTIENLIGGLSLFGDKPIRVGDLCQYGGDKGTVEAIGLRSTRIRGLDRTLTTIPNAVLSKMPVVNFTQRDRMLIQCVIGVRYETSPEQLRYLLARIREMLLSHPRIHPDPARARFIGFGASSLDIEVFAYATTSDWGEFLGIREDVLLRIMDLVAQSGTGIAFPSQTLYFARDDGLDADRTQAAEAQVRQWRETGHLPFPNFAAEQAAQMRGSLIYPPPGSPGQPLPAKGARGAGGHKEGQSSTAPQTDQPKEPSS